MRQIWIVVIITAVAAAAGWWYVYWRPVDERVMELPPVPLSAGEPEAEPRTPVREPAVLLPSLGESDSYVRGMAAGLAQGALYVRWLASDDLLRRGVAIVDNVAEGELPRQLLTPLRLDGSMVVAKEEDEVYLDPASYARYDALVGTIASVDAEHLSRIYFVIEPLLDSAYEELGYPGGRFRPRLIAAIDHLLAAPVFEGEIKLTRHSVAFEFESPELEALPETYKQLVRMGPDHTRAIQGKLTELRQTLEAGMVAGR